MTDYEGGCQCGAVRYVATVDKLVAYACHCRECQKQSASAFGISVPVSSADFRIEGALKCYCRPTDIGTHTDCWFCETCGTRLYHQGVEAPEWIAIKGGSLDHADLLKPAAHIWVRSKQPWVTIPPGTATHDTQPDDPDDWLQLAAP